mgnify:CR=1 FL=1
MIAGSARLDQAFQTTQLIPFLTADFPTPALFLEILYKLADAGIQIIEIGIPFSDPIADGTVIQQASQIALKNNFSIPPLLDHLSDFRRAFPQVALVIMSYMNPVYHYGLTAFYAALKARDIDGLLLVDYPVSAPITDAGIAMIRLVAPNTTLDRLRQITPTASGFLYYISQHATTGTTEMAPDYTHLALVKQHSPLPVVVGFGIQSAPLVAKLNCIADGVVIGSAFLKPFLTDTRPSVVTNQLDYIKALKERVK